MGMSHFSFFIFIFYLFVQKRIFRGKLKHKPEYWTTSNILDVLMRLFKEEEKVQRAKFYPRIIPLANFLTNVSLIIYFAHKFSWTNACFKGHFIVQVLMRLQPCGHSRWVLLLKMPNGKFLSWLLFNCLSK